ncbi:MAG: GNAT family N-acetyltransferase [Silicimonas sp.]|nr:GNAT family N-acetyltransferase [Silicimonas sp.]
MSLSDWTAPDLPPRTVLQGRYARLEPLSQDHTPELWAAHEGAGEVWRYIPVGPFDSEAALGAWVDAVRIAHDPMQFAVRMEDGRIGGTLSLMRIAPAAGSIEVGYIVFTPRLQRTREATEAVYLTLKWAFEAGYRRFEWKCDAANLPSRRAAQRFGLSYEGIFRQATVVKGRNRDTAWFAAIDSEWPALRAAFETWLAPANFDDVGRQKRALGDLTSPILVARDPGLQK